MEKTKQQEVDLLNSYYSNGSNQILIVYEVIRTGSEDVIREFVKGKPCLFYSTCSAAERLQQYIWSKELAKKGFELPEYPTYTQIFEQFEKRAKELDNPVIVLINDFENIMKNSPDFLSEISKVVYRDSHPQMMVVLVGSNSAWIENSMVEKLGSQAQYISGFLKIKPYTFQEMHKRFMDMPYDDVIRTYSIFGGKALLWDYFDPKKSFRENVCEKFLDYQNSVLLKLTDLMLEENLRETAVYNTILYGLANGQNKLNDIHHATGFSRAKIMVYLKSLIELGVVEKVFSFATTGHENVQKGVYRICDGLTGFYFRFLYQHASNLIRYKPEEFYERFIEKDIDKFVSYAYKLVCREYIDKCSSFNKLPFVIDEEGEWVGKMGTIDIVAQSDTGDTLVGICDFEHEFDVTAMEQLRNCCKRARLTPDYYYFFSAVGFDDSLRKLAEEMPEVKLIGLDELRID